MPEREPRTYKKRLLNFPPTPLRDYYIAAKIHGTTFRQEVMDAASRNRKLAELQEDEMRLIIVDKGGAIQGELLFDGSNTNVETGAELPPNVIPFRRSVS